MKLYRITTTTHGREYVDWIEADNKVEALRRARLEATEVGIPTDAKQVAVECTGATLKPIT